jgi:hypothetical protein
MIPNSIFVATVLLIALFPTSSIVVTMPNDDIATIHQLVLELAVRLSASNISDTVQNALNYNSTLNSSQMADFSG